MYLVISRSFLLRMRNVSDKSCRENQNTLFILNNVFRKLCRLWDNMEKYSRTGEATDGHVAHAHCMLDT
jgi:hypothetical protein